MPLSPCFFVPFVLLAQGQEARPVAPPARPAAITTEGVPDVPAELAATLHRYQEIRSATFADWLAGGGMLVASRIGNLHQLYAVREPGGKPEPVTTGDEPVSDGTALEDGSVLFPRASGGDESYQILRWRVGAEPQLLTDGKSRHLLGPLDRPRQRVAYTSTARNGKDEDLYAMNLAPGAGPELLLEAKGQKWSLEDWSPDGRQALLSRYVSANESYAYLFHLEERRLEPLPPELGPATPPRVRRDALRFGATPGQLLLVSDARGEHRELARLELAAGTYEWLSGDIAWDVDALALSRDRRQAALLVNEEGRSRLYTFDPTAGAASRRAMPIPEGIISGVVFSPDGAQLGFTLTTAVQPAEAYSYAPGSGRLERWTFSESAGFTAADFVAATAFSYPSFDGRQIPAWILRPPASGRVPVIISIHGGPEGQSRPGFLAIRQYQVRELGAAVILPNVRGSTGYGKTYTTLDNGKLREESVRDIGALLDWIARDERLDPTRVAVIGGSYGGYMVLASLVTFGARLRAGVDVVGISNFETFLRNTSAYRRDLRRAEYGDERDPEMREHFARISPERRMGDLRSALLVVHGSNDPRVPISEARQIVARGREAGQPVWTLYAANEGHGFTRRENVDYEQAVTAMFLRRFLLPAATSPTDGPGWHERAYQLFRDGRFAESLAAFEAAIKAGGRTHSEDECWERGLARYYAGDFEGGRRQFEGYHKVGALDIENGLWILICEAEKKGLEKGRALLPEYRDRRRPPFPALLELYLGKGTVEAVLAEASAQPAGRPHEEALFYAHLYTGKYLQAAGERAKAREHFQKALEHPVEHFMLWCAQAEMKRP